MSASFTKAGTMAVRLLLAVVAIVAATSAGCDGDIKLTGAGAPASPPDASADAATVATACKVDADCRVASSHCDTASGTCVQCLVDAHCTSEEVRRCDVALHRCVACGIPADCGEGLTCEPMSRRCVAPCGDGGSCPSSAPTCDVPRGFCLQCTADAECSSEHPFCDDTTGQCVACTADAQCPTSSPRCDRLMGRCVKCLASADCPVALPVCDPSSWTCVSPAPKPGD